MCVSPISRMPSSLRMRYHFCKQGKATRCAGPARTRIGLPQTRARAIPEALDTQYFRQIGLADDHVVRVATILSDPVHKEQAARSISFLRTAYKPFMVVKLVQSQPELLTVGLEEWHQFLTGYGLSDVAVWRLLRHCPRLLLPHGLKPAAEGGGGAAAAPAVNTPYNAGAAIVFLKRYGWSDEDIVSRVLPCYPEVLAASPEQLQASVDFLRSRSFDEEAICRMVRTFPPLLAEPYNQGLFQLIDRIRASAHNKYVVSGSYHV